MKNSRVGELFEVMHGYKIKIVTYNSSSDVIVEFQDEFKSLKKTNMSNIHSGRVLNPYAPVICGVGRVGIVDNVKNDKVYDRWKAMINRCYNPKNRSYNFYGGRGVRVCEDWHIYTNFKRDLESMENYCKLEDGWHIDKDLSGHNLYSKDTCVIINPKHNILVSTQTLKTKNVSGVVGVHKVGRRWRSAITINGIREYKTFDSMEEAIEYREKLENKHRKDWGSYE